MLKRYSAKFFQNNDLKLGIIAHLKFTLKSQQNFHNIEFKTIF